MHEHIVLFVHRSEPQEDAQKKPKGLVCHMWDITIGSADLSACGLCVPLHIPFWSFYYPQARFSPAIFWNSLPNECWPIPFPSYKNRPRWPKMLRECGYYCTYTQTQGPLWSSLVNDAPNLARRNESKVSSHHHHHHHSSAGPWLSPSHIICSRENIIFSVMGSSLTNSRCYSFFSYLPVSLSLLVPL